MARSTYNFGLIPLHEAVHLVWFRAIHRAKTDLFVELPAILAHNKRCRVVIVTIGTNPSFIEPLDHATDVELVSTRHQSYVSSVGEANCAVVPIQICGGRINRVHGLDRWSVHKNWPRQGLQWIDQYWLKANIVLW